MEGISAIIIMILMIALYFVPAIVGRNKKNAGAIFVANLFFGWTLIGWVIVLIWGVTKD